GGVARLDLAVLRHDVACVLDVSHLRVAYPHQGSLLRSRSPTSESGTEICASSWTSESHQEVAWVALSEPASSSRARTSANHSAIRQSVLPFVPGKKLQSCSHRARTPSWFTFGSSIRFLPSSQPMNSGARDITPASTSHLVRPV